MHLLTLFDDTFIYYSIIPSDNAAECSLNFLNKKVKSFPSKKTHRTMLIFISLALSQTPAYTARPWTGASVLRGVPIYSQLSLALIAPTHGGMPRLS